jgi:hypothetical protein
MQSAKVNIDEVVKSRHSRLLLSLPRHAGSRGESYYRTTYREETIPDEPE